jgi:hypothetical protein
MHAVGVKVLSRGGDAQAEKTLVADNRAGISDLE